jgi:ribose-phosphate pyrophosphokinase
MTARLVSGSGPAALASAVAAELGTELVPCEVERFPDGELRPVVAEVRGDDVFVFRSTGPPVNEHVVELLLLLDACRRAGAQRITAVVPYFGYARQDRRSNVGEAVGSRVLVDAVASSGADRLLVVDPHTAALEAMSSIPCDMLTAARTVADAIAPSVSDDAVIVAPDLGAVKLAERYASLLGRPPVAVVRKTRVSGEEVLAHELMGNVEGRPAVIVDDMISTGRTIEAAMQLLQSHGAAPAPTIVATHGPLVAGAMERIAHLGPSGVYLTDTLPVEGAEKVRVCTVRRLLADAIDRLTSDRPLDDLLFYA